jgi:putative tryptophan/tyrosine transport system substrate-binding protein
MKTLRSFAVGGLMLVGVASVCWGARDGNMLLQTCTTAVRTQDPSENRTASQQDAYDTGYCRGIIMGVIDGNSYLSFSSQSLYCLPPDRILPSQFTRVVLQYLQQHPERLHRHHNDLVIEAMRTAFPCAPAASRPQTIGYLGNAAPALEAHQVAAFREGLRQHGYMEGQNLTIWYKWAEGQQERHAVLAQELVHLQPDVILTAGTPGTLAAKHATQSIPIVTAIAGDPVAAGLVASLAHPGGNVTGLTTLAPELEGKRLELFTQAVPQLSRVVALLNPANPFTTIAWQALAPAAAALGVQLQPVEVQGPQDLDRAFAAIKEARPDGLIVIPDRFLLTYRAAIVQFMAMQRLPGMFPFREFVQEGGLLSYGPDYTDNYRRAATYVAKILHGTKPANLPMEQPTKFEFLINLKTAQALGLTIPPSLLFQANEVIR